MTLEMLPLDLLTTHVISKVLESIIKNHPALFLKDVQPSRLDRCPRGMGTTTQVYMSTILYMIPYIITLQEYAISDSVKVPFSNASCTSDLVSMTLATELDDCFQPSCKLYI